MQSLTFPGCKAFEELKKKHGDLPADYEGALEKFLREKKEAQGVTSLTTVGDATGPEGKQASDYTESAFSDDDEPNGQQLEDVTCFISVKRVDDPSDDDEAFPSPSESLAAQLNAAKARTATGSHLPARPDRSHISAARPRAPCTTTTHNLSVDSTSSTHKVKFMPPQTCTGCPCNGLAEKHVHPSHEPGVEADDEDPREALKRLAHVTSSASSKQKKMPNAQSRHAARTEQDLQHLRQMLTAQVDKSVRPPAPRRGRKWAMVDSGSQPNVADCAKEFPEHEIRVRAGQMSGLMYKGANGARIPTNGK